MEVTCVTIVVFAYSYRAVTASYSSVSVQLTAVYGYIQEYITPWTLWYIQEYITPQSVQRLIQLCIGSWSSGIGSLRHNTVHIWGEPGESRVLLDQKQWCPASRPALRWCEVYAWHQKIRFRSTKTLHRAGSALHTLGGYVLLVYLIKSMSLRSVQLSTMGVVSAEFQVEDVSHCYDAFYTCTVPTSTIMHMLVLHCSMHVILPA